MQSPVVGLLVRLMLTQARECVLEQTLLDYCDRDRTSRDAGRDRQAPPGDLLRLVELAQECATVCLSLPFSTSVLTIFKMALIIFITDDWLGRSLFLFKKQVLAPVLPTLNQMNMDKILHTPNVLLYGIHLWADLDRDRRVGGSSPNQNDYVFFVILITHPKSYIETTHSLQETGTVANSAIELHSEIQTAF